MSELFAFSLNPETKTHVEEIKIEATEEEPDKEL